MRRRRPSPADEAGLPESLGDFTAGEWKGRSEYQQWRAWDKARRVWAVTNLPGGIEDLPDWDGVVPDQPWEEVEL